MNNENEEEKIKTFFIDKLLKEKKIETYFSSKIFEEYVKYKNAVNIFIQTNKLPNATITKKHQKNIIKYNNIKCWIKMIIKPLEANNSISKKSYSYANIKSNQVPKPLCDINLQMLYYFKNFKNFKNNVIYSTTTNIFNHTNFIKNEEEEKNENKNDIYYNDEIIINKLKQYYENFPETFYNFMQIGMPNSFRLIAWNIVNNINYSNDVNFVINNINYSPNNIYKHFLLKDLENKKNDLIYGDIKRTFPLQNYESINKSKKDNDEKSLFNILKAFCNIDEELGYCQGMNYLSGFLLLNTNFDEKSVFFLLISIFSNTFMKRAKNNFSLRGLFIEEFPLLYFYRFIFDDLLLKYVPKLHNHLLNNDIPNDVWIIKWIQTIFIMILPINWSKKLWDNIFSSDFYFIIKFSISLCLSLSKDILELNDQQQLMDYFRNIQKIPMNYNNSFLEKKFDIDDILERARKIPIDVEYYMTKYEKEDKIRGKKFIENIYKINNVKYFDINYNNFTIKKTNTTVKDREKSKIRNNSIITNMNLNLNDISVVTKNGSNKLLKFPKHSFSSQSNSSDINNIKLNSKKKLCSKYKIIKKNENQIMNKADLNKKLIIKNKSSNSNIYNNSGNKNENFNKQKNHSPRLINNIKNKELIINTSDIKKDKYLIQNKNLNYSKILNFQNSTNSNNNSNSNSNVNVNSESMNTMINKNHYQKILYKRKKNMGNISKRNGFSSSNIKQMNKKNSSNKTEINDILNSTKKNLSKEMHLNSNSNTNSNNNNINKENDTKTKNGMKMKISSISIINGNKGNVFENNSRNNLINELKRRKQYLSNQIKYYLTNDSTKYNNTFINSEKKKMINSGSNSKNNIKEMDKNINKKNMQNNKENKPTKYIKINK